MVQVKKYYFLYITSIGERHIYFISYANPKLLGKFKHKVIYLYTEQNA